MDIVRELFEYNSNVWETKTPNVKEEIEKYNNSLKRFLFYPWGVFITAYARRNLWTGILECKHDYIYSDTDSIKILNYEKHINYINRYNQIAINNLKEMCEYYKIDFNLCNPKTIKGKEKMLGIWDFEGVYSNFKTLGAKRYMFVKDSELSFTISGVNKKFAVPYLIEKFNNNFNDIFNYFNNDFYIPNDYTGKLTHTYIDDKIELNLKDYNGVSCHIKELSFIHLEKCDFSLSLSKTFIDYLKSIGGF